MIPKNIHSLFLFSLVLLAAVSSCDYSNSNQSATKRQGPFFDLKSFFQLEKDRLDGISIIKKSVSINGEKETRQVNNKEIAKSLSIFSDSDINRLAWKEKYTVDSIKTDLGELHSLQYTAVDDNMKTQSLSITFQGEKVDSILIITQITGFATENKKRMIYIPHQGYRIFSNQKTLMSEPQEIFVEVVYH